jgi:hypothetical protein
MTRGRQGRHVNNLFTRSGEITTIKKKQLMFARVRAYILQHLAVSASDLLSAIEVETLVGNDTTTSNTPLAPIDANANGG